MTLFVDAGKIDSYPLLFSALRALCFVSVTALMVCCDYLFTHVSPLTALWDRGGQS